MSSFCRVMIVVRGAVRRSESVCAPRTWLLDSPVPDLHDGQEEPRALVPDQKRHSVQSGSEGSAGEWSPQVAEAMMQSFQWFARKYIQWPISECCEGCMWLRLGNRCKLAELSRPRNNLHPNILLDESS